MFSNFGRGFDLERCADGMKASFFESRFIGLDIKSILSFSCRRLSRTVHGSQYSVLSVSIPAIFKDSHAFCFLLLDPSALPHSARGSAKLLHLSLVFYN